MNKTDCPKSGFGRLLKKCFLNLLALLQGVQPKLTLVVGNPRGPLDGLTCQGPIPMHTLRKRTRADNLSTEEISGEFAELESRPPPLGSPLTPELFMLGHLAAPKSVMLGTSFT